MQDPKSLNLEALSILETQKGGFVLELEELKNQPDFYGWVKMGSFPTYMYLNGCDDGVAMRWLWNKEYESTSLQIWSLLSKNKSTIFDIGAHTGTYSLIAAKETKANILAIEPSLLNVARLIMNKNYNQLKNIRICPMAASSKNCVLGMNQYSSIGLGYCTSGDSVSMNYASESLTYSIQATTIDHLIKSLNLIPPYLLKIDVEGHESEVLTGSDLALKARGIFIIECTDQIAAEKCTELLKRSDYIFYEINEISNKLIQVELFRPQFSNGKINRSKLNRLALPKEIAKDIIETLRNSLGIEIE